MTEENYADELTKVKEIMAKEISLIEQAQKDADASKSEDDMNDEDALNAGYPPKNSGTNKKRGICRYYVNRKCKHGPKGKGCTFEHPKICKYYAKLGENRKGGCKKGENCRFTHPKMCFQAKDGLVCNRKNCHFLHSYGYKYNEENEMPGASRQKERQSSDVLSIPIQTKERSSWQNSRENGLGGLPQNSIEKGSSQNGRSEAENDFLEIKGQLEDQSQTMKLILQQHFMLMRERPYQSREKMDLDQLGPCQRRF